MESLTEDCLSETLVGKRTRKRTLTPMAQKKHLHHIGRSQEYLAFHMLSNAQVFLPQVFYQLGGRINYGRTYVISSISHQCGMEGILL